jgi:hypothetical protein
VIITAQCVHHCMVCQVEVHAEAEFVQHLQLCTSSVSGAVLSSYAACSCVSRWFWKTVECKGVAQTRAGLLLVSKRAQNGCRSGPVDAISVRQWVLCCWLGAHSVTG